MKYLPWIILGVVGLGITFLFLKKGPISAGVTITPPQFQTQYSASIGQTPMGTKAAVENGLGALAQVGINKGIDYLAGLFSKPDPNGSMAKF